MKGRADMNKKVGTVVILFAIAVFLIPTSVAIFVRRGGGSASLVSATWNVTLEQTGVNNNLTVVPETATATYTLNVKSLSEVDVKYSIVIGNLPTGIEVSLNGVDFSQASNGTITFNNAGTILYSAQNRTNTHTLTFRGATGASVVSNQAVTINVIAEQMTVS